MKKEKAFTLAEVLITLTIIGIIAAITIPNLMQGWRKHERITQIKTAYSIIQNATRMAVSEHGNPDGWSFSNAWDYTPKYFIPYTKVQKKCGMALAPSYHLSYGCFKDNSSNGTWNFLNGEAEPNKGTHYTMILKNGMHVGIYTTPNIGFVLFFVDVDGKQGTTTLGKDVFVFKYLLETGKFETGGDINGYAPKDDCKQGGLACTRVLEINHWEFPDDYPVKKF